MVEHGHANILSLGGDFRVALKIVVTFLLFLLSACAERDVKPVKQAKFNIPANSDAELVWRSASVAYPVRGSAGSVITTNSVSLDPRQMAGVQGRPLWPVIFIQDGCFATSPPLLLKALAEQGFVAIHLSSHARQHELLDCRTDRNAAANADSILRAKEAELRYAIAALKFVNWADEENIFVIGHHEAGASVALGDMSGIKARIVADWNCQQGSAVEGLIDDDKAPVFAVATSLAGQSAPITCRSYMQNTSESQSLDLTQSFALNVLLEPVVFTQMLKFLDRQLFQ